MPLLVKARSFLRNLLLSRRVEADLDQEVRSHLELLTEENIRAGMPPKEAQRAARIELGGIESDQVLAGDPGHFDEPGVCKKNAMVVVGNDDAFVEHLQHGLHPAEPFRLFHVDGISFSRQHRVPRKREWRSFDLSSERNF